MAYFGETLAALTLEDAAYLAALSQAPSMLHPTRFPDRAIARRNGVIRAMRDAGRIDAARADLAMEMDLIVQQPLGRCAQ